MIFKGKDGSIFNLKIISSATNEITFRVFFKEKKIAYLTILEKPDFLVSFDVFVEPEFRRKGIASFLYDYASLIKNKKIIPNEYWNREYKSTIDSVLFWKNRGILLTNIDQDPD